MSAFQAEVGEWRRETFPAGDRHTVLTHLVDEVAELIDAEEQDYASENQVIDEAADCYLLLLGYANLVGFDLEEAAQVKHLRNTRRTWGQPDARGVVRHTTEGEQP